ncbi:hypothetical protein RHGRI_007517 [Rhododendron griersonianum]|uniref:DUF4283 domain-containing protein n=1 Tax=Rhododendron griersonianum TaxID=479676 RepID=A0AAV6KX13_9ERIC|nr:hypothetical protein RHGRI_007517 [Rhododendron griersonianum]
MGPEEDPEEFKGVPKVILPPVLLRKFREPWIALRMEVSSFSFPSLQEVFPSCSSPLAAARVFDSVPVEVLPSIKVLSTEILLLRSQVENKMVEKSGGSGNSNNSRVPAIGLTVGVSWRDTVAPPSEESPRMRLEFFPPVIDGDKVKVSTPNQFGVSGAYRQIVEAGSWHFGGRLMVLQQWSPDLEFEKEGLNRLPIWVQLHDVPLQLWTAPGLSYIASSVVRPLYADGMTETGKRISYAKICVEVTVDSPLHHSDEIGEAAGVVNMAGPGKVWVVKTGKDVATMDLSIASDVVISEAAVGTSTPSAVVQEIVDCTDVVIGKGDIMAKRTPGSGSVRASSVMTGTRKVLVVGGSPKSNMFAALSDGGVCGGKVAGDVVSNEVSSSSLSPIHCNMKWGAPPVSEISMAAQDSYEFLPNDLGVGMTDPDAVMMALDSVGLSKLKGRSKALGVRKGGKKPKKQ